MGFAIAFVLAAVPKFYKKHWYIALSPFFLSLLLTAHSHRPVYLLLGLALTLPVAVVGSFIALSKKENW
jgi:hypothetical protein